MKPIDSHQQENEINQDISLPVIATVLGHRKALALVSPARVLLEVEQGLWDSLIKAPSIGIAGRSLLLYLMGTQESRMKRNHQNVNTLFFVSKLARGMVLRGANPLWKDPAGRDAIDQAFAASNLDLVKDWTVELSVDDLQQRRVNELPWLHVASLYSHESMIEFLLDRGFDANLQTPSGETPLFYASSPETVLALLKAGANPEHRNEFNIDARVFWTRGRDLTQAEQAILASKLPNPQVSVSRDTHIADFFASLHTAGKGMFVKQLKSLGLKTHEKTSKGMGLVGTLGGRMIDPKSSADGISLNKTIACADVLIEMNEFVQASTEDEWVLFVAGACRFGGAPSRLKRMGLYETDLALNPDFWVKCMDKIQCLADATQYGRELIVDQALNVLEGAIHKMSEEEQIYPHLASLYIEMNFKQAQSKMGPYSYNNEGYLAAHQKMFHSFLEQYPQWGAQEHEATWLLALFIPKRPQHETSNRNLFNPLLADYLVSIAVPLPPSAMELVSTQLKECNEATAQTLSAFQYQILNQSTNPAQLPTRRRPGL